LATFDVNAAAAQARAGAIPPGWQVYPLRARTAWLPVVLAPLMALFMVGVTIYRYGARKPLLSSGG